MNYDYDNIVVGSSFEAVLYAFVNNYPIIYSNYDIPFRFDYIDHKSNEMLEQGPLERLVARNQLYSYKFEGYWRCLDTPRDLKLINDEVKYGHYPYSLSNLD